MTTTPTSPAPDLCRSTERSKGKLLVCDQPLNHKGDHMDASGQKWPQSGNRPPYSNERAFVL